MKRPWREKMPLDQADTFYQGQRAPAGYRGEHNEHWPHSALRKRRRACQSDLRFCGDVFSLQAIIAPPMRPRRDSAAWERALALMRSLQAQGPSSSTRERWKRAELYAERERRQRRRSG